MIKSDYDVRCFRRIRSSEGRSGIWIFTRKTGRRGLFINGDRNEFESPKYSQEELTLWSTEGGFLPVEEITPDEVLKELMDWPEGQSQVQKVFERHRAHNETPV